MANSICRFLRDESAATAIEFGLIASLIAIVIIALIAIVIIASLRRPGTELST
jgi:pilus assembly protein Flp/PilA